MNKKLLYRYARAYGTRMDVLMEGVNKVIDFGEDFGGGVYEAEIKYLIRHEFARDLDDILWRRTKLGLHISDKTKANLVSAFPDLLEKYKPKND